MRSNYRSDLQDVPLRQQDGDSVGRATCSLVDRRSTSCSSVRLLTHMGEQAQCATEDAKSRRCGEQPLQPSLRQPVAGKGVAQRGVSQTRHVAQTCDSLDADSSASAHAMHGHEERGIWGKVEHNLARHPVPERCSSFNGFQSAPELDPMRFAHGSPHIAHKGLSRRFRGCAVGPVCEGVEGGTAFERPHVYARSPEEDLLWDDAAYADTMMQNSRSSRKGSIEERCQRGNACVPCFKPVPQTLCVRTSAEPCGKRSCVTPHTQLEQNSVLWDKRRACAEATEHSRDGSNESVDDLGFTTPASPEDLAYDEAQAIDSVFRQRSGSAGNQLLAYSRAVAATQEDSAELCTAITPRALDNDDAAGKAANGLLQQSACSPVSPSCVAQLLVNDSHVYLRVQGSENAAVLAADSEDPPAVSAADSKTHEVDSQVSQTLVSQGIEQDAVEGGHEAASGCTPVTVDSHDTPAEHHADCQEQGRGDVDLVSGPQEPADTSAGEATHVQGEGTSGSVQLNNSHKSAETDSPTNTFARALSLSLRRLSQSMNRVVDGQPVNQRAVQAHVCERLARKGQHVLALAEAFAQVGLAERLPAAMIVSTAPPSFWPSILVVYKLSKLILEHSTATAASDAGNGLSSCSAQTAPAVPHLRATPEYAPTCRAAEVQTARPVDQAGRHARQRSQPVVVDFPRQLPDEQHTFRFRKGFNVLDSAAEEESEEVVLYTSSIASLRKTAADTRRMRQILDAFQVTYQEVDLALQPRMRRRMLEISDDFNVLPQLHCRGKLIGDGDTCFDLHDFGELMPILINGDDPCGDGEDEPSESPSSEDATGDRHIFEKQSSASCDSSIQGPREFEKMELPGELLQKLQAGVESAALRACLAELPPEATRKEDADSGEHSVLSPSLCALTGLPCGDWKVDHVEASLAGSQTVLSEGKVSSGDTSMGSTVVIAAAANLWLSLVDEELPYLSKMS